MHSEQRLCNARTNLMERVREPCALICRHGGQNRLVLQRRPAKAHDVFGGAPDVHDATIAVEK